MGAPAGRAAATSPSTSTTSATRSLRAPSRRDRGAGQARHHRHGPACSSTPGPTATRSSPESYRDRRVGWSDVWVQRRRRAPIRTPTRSAGCTASSTSTRWSCSRSRTPATSTQPHVMGEYVPAAHPRAMRAARRPQAAGDHPARGRRRSRSTATCCAGRTGRCGSGSTTARACRCTRSATSDGDRVRPIAHRLSFAEMVVPYRDPTDRPLPPHRVRHRRVGPGLHDARRWSWAATASARSATSTRSLHDTHGRAVHDPQRDLHPRGGQRACCGSTSTTTPAPRCAGCGGSWCRSTSTVANYEYLVYWRFYQDGNIECEVRATGIMVTTPLRRGRAAAVRHAGRRAHLRAVPPALPRRAARPGRRRRRQHGLRDRVRAAADRARTTRTGSRWCSAATPLRTESEGKQDYDWRHAAGLEGGQRRASPTASARPVAYKLVPGACVPGDVRPRARRCSSAPR